MRSRTSATAPISTRAILAVRQAVAAKVNITYKLLYNDAVAMTGGQPIDGKLSVEDVANQLYWEGVRPVVVVTDEPDKYRCDYALAGGHDGPTPQGPRARAEGPPAGQGRVGSDLRPDLRGGKAASSQARHVPQSPEARLHQPGSLRGLRRLQQEVELRQRGALDTEFGRKRKIDQSSCNKDFSCLEGFCPSFVSVLGGGPRKGEAANAPDELASIFSGLPAPKTLPLDEVYNVLITGIGGTGVLTVGAILGMAAHLDGKSCSVMDITGMAQKGGAVITHLRFGASRDKLFATRLWQQSADLVIGCDLVVSTGQATLDLVRSDSARILVNSDVVPTAQFQANQALDLSQEKLLGVLRKVVSAERLSAIAATSAAVRLMGDSIATNVFMLGYALQKGCMPIALGAVEQAISPQRRRDRAESARAQLGTAGRT
jgi:indolepyruvate ferredoxin oxidoreductase